MPRPTDDNTRSNNLIIIFKLYYNFILINKYI